MTELERQKMIEDRYKHIKYKAVKQDISILESVTDEEFLNFAIADVDWFLANMPKPDNEELRDKVYTEVSKYGFYVQQCGMLRNSPEKEITKKYVSKILALLPKPEPKWPENPYVKEFYPFNGIPKVTNPCWQMWQEGFEACKSAFEEATKC